jgi:hypothetical protein
VTAIGAEKLDLFVAKLLVVAIELAAALRAGHPEYFSHDSSQEEKIEIRVSKFETKQTKINPKAGNSKTSDPIWPRLEFAVFGSFEFVSDEIRICNCIHTFGTRSNTARAM